MDRGSEHIFFVALTGFMGAGKSSVGRALAALLGWKFVDLDEQIERRARRSISDIFLTQGEPRFRQIEEQCLEDSLERATSPTVLSLGGGTFIEPHNADLLRTHSALVVFLECELDVLLSRCRVGSEDGGGSLRPLAGDPDAFRGLYARRLPCYRSADLTVATGGKTVEQVTNEIAARLLPAGRSART